MNDHAIFKIWRFEKHMFLLFIKDLQTVEKER